VTELLVVKNLDIARVFENIEWLTAYSQQNNLQTVKTNKKHQKTQADSISACVNINRERFSAYPEIILDIYM
jgi:hypothetical protein